MCGVPLLTGLMRLARPACAFPQILYPVPRANHHTRRLSLCHSPLTFSNRFCGCIPTRTRARRHKGAVVPPRLAQTLHRTLTPCFGTPSRCWRSRHSFCARIAHSGCSACGLTTSSNSQLVVWSDRRGVCLETCCVSRAQRFHHTGGSHDKAGMEATANERTEGQHPWPLKSCFHGPRGSINRYCYWHISQMSKRRRSSAGVTWSSQSLLLWVEPYANTCASDHVGRVSF